MRQLRPDDDWFTTARVNYAHYVILELVTLRNEKKLEKNDKCREKNADLSLLLRFLLRKSHERMNSMVLMSK